MFGFFRRAPATRTQLTGTPGSMARPRTSPQPEIPGLAARRIATDLVDGVLRRRLALDEQLAGKNAHPGIAALADRDRALMRRLAATALRRLGTLRHVLGGFLEKGFPADAPRTESILLIGAVQILWLEVPDHAAVDLSVRLAQADRRAARYAGLVNAVLRRVAQNRERIDGEQPERDTPGWLFARWRENYGLDTARAIARANGHEPALDLTVKEDAASWAERLHGRVLAAGGGVRTLAQGAVSLLPGFAEGAWWVQDAAAALPARLLGDVKNLNVADLCAAPGGKTAQLALAGAHVTAIDRSPARIARLKENLARLSLKAETVTADVIEWPGGDSAFDAVLLDAPCSATGTIRRHPDVPWLKSEADIGALTGLQQRLLDRAAAMLTPGGVLVYCVCSLEPEEGAAQIAALLARDKRLARKPIDPDEIGGHADFLTGDGDLRTLPFHLHDPDPRWAGLDGFYAARLVRQPA